MVENALAALPAIMTRLRERVPDLAAVLSAPDLATVIEHQQPSPNVQVIYDGYALRATEGARAGAGAAQVIVQRYFTVVTVKHAGDQKYKDASLAIAGKLFVAVFQALAGWQPVLGMKPLRLAPAPRSQYSPAFAYVPLAFEAELILTQE